jgi:hypothetical protein
LVGRNFTALDRKEQKRIVGLFYDLFAGRLDTYAVRVEFPEATAYIPSTYAGSSQHTAERMEKITREIGSDEFGDEAVRAHLTGKYLIGAYPIQDDSKVRFFALDFDGGDGDPWEQALRQATILKKEAGLNVYIERSQGGNGFHIWGFLEEPIDAGRVRHALAPHIEKVETFDRMFPNQDGVSETRPLGNLIALPLHGERLTKGNSAFVRRGKDGKPVPVEDQWEFLDNIELNSTELFDELFEEAGEYVPEREHTKYEGEAEGLSDSFKMVHPVFGCEFVRQAMEDPESIAEPLWYALACNFAQLEDGRELFHEVSARDTLRYSARATDQKYDQALRANKPHSCEVIRGMGGNCECDRRFPGKVYHPFDLVKIPFKKLVESVGIEGDVSQHVISASEGFDLALERLAEIEKDPEGGQGRRYGIKTLDAATRMRDSDLIIIAARPGMGKSAMAGTVIDNTAIEKIPNYFFSAEMAKLQVFTRQAAIRSGVSLTRMATGQLTKSDWEKLRAAKEQVRDQDNYPLFVDDLSRSTDRIFEISARLVARHGKGIIWIDYLQLLQKEPRESMFDAVTRITHDLKLLAKALQCPVVALTQLNRTADDATSDSQTYDSWLRGSGDIEQSADVIIFLLGEKGPGIKERIAAIHKERHRESGLRVMLEFNQPIMRFAAAGTYGLTPGTVERKQRDTPPVAGKKGKKRRPAEQDEEPDVEEQMRANKRAMKEYTDARDGRTDPDFAGL